jgi:hypothetical protein
MSRLLPFALLLGWLIPAPLPAAGPPAPTARARAVTRALAYLGTAQDRADGSWPAGRTRKSVAVTSLAVMAFLSAGHTPGKGPHGVVIEKGIRAVLRQQLPNGLFASAAWQEMYHHAIATLMLAQAHAVSAGPLRAEVRKALDQAVALTLRAQRTLRVHRGGWRYRVFPNDGSDLSVTGWQVLALCAARDAGCDVPRDKLERALEFVRRCEDRGSGGFRYQPYSRVTPTCTASAIGALALLARDGASDPALPRAAAYLLRQRLSWGGPYFSDSVYHGAHALALLGGARQSAYRKKLHDVLLPRQTAGGSWAAAGSDTLYGPSYATAMAVLALTAEDRRLPPFRPVRARAK